MTRTLQPGDRLRGRYTGRVYVVRTIEPGPYPGHGSFPRVCLHDAGFTWYGPYFWTFFENLDERPRRSVRWKVGGKTT